MKHGIPAAAAMAALLMACGGGSSPSTTPGAASPQVGGAYDVTVRLLDNDCGGTPTVQAQPTSVAHSPGAATFTLTHGGLQLAGQVARDGTFTTQPLAVTDPMGPATLALAGRFTSSGLAATGTVTVAQAAGTCRYTVGWTGVKQGPPNVVG
jgi:hypothetical protein